ncbi:MAG TPA: hypothetical protein VM577_06000, partial [Anaerovoracaceae bacterium]|nr:hypothetical protein [Anaerovoracaceae bacterium]
SVKKEPEILDIKGEFDDEYDFITEAFYCVQERAEIKMKDFLYCLEEGDLLMLTRTKSDEPLEVEIYNAQPQEMNIVRSRIYY